MGNCCSSSNDVVVKRTIPTDNEPSGIWNETKVFSLDTFVDLVMETPGGVSEVVRRAYEEKEELEQKAAALKNEENRPEDLHLGKIIEWNEERDDESFDSTISEGSIDPGLDIENQSPSRDQVIAQISDDTV